MEEKRTLYKHVPHWHKPINVNDTHTKEQQGLNAKIAVFITRGMGTMACAYFFALLAIIGFPGFHATVPQYVQWLSQTFIQLTALSVLAVGQNIISRHSELIAEEQFHTTEKSYSDIEQIVAHLNAQDAAILAISQRTDAIVSLLTQPARPDAPSIDHITAIIAKLSEQDDALMHQNDMLLDILQRLERRKSTVPMKRQEG